MIRSRAKGHRRPRRGTPQSAAHDRRDEPLRVVVRILARQAARERFEQEITRQRDPSREVTMQ
jgi:hypothetical protein